MRRKPCARSLSTILHDLFLLDVLLEERVEQQEALIGATHHVALLQTTHRRFLTGVVHADVHRIVLQSETLADPTDSESFANPCTFLSCVAENSIVCRFFGRSRMIAFMSSSKPICRMRSASSITKHCRFSKLKPFVFCRWSNKRPGVAMRIEIPFTSFEASLFRFAPPITIPCVKPCADARSVTTPKICIANSRVGVMIIAPVPCRCFHFRRDSSSITGTTNASVFPEPVLCIREET